MGKRFLSLRSVASIGIVLAVLAGVAPLAALEKGRQLEFGVDMARRGLWAEALFRFERAVEEDPGNSRIVNNLAVAHEAVGEFDKALELYRQAVKLDPDNAAMKRNYARFVEFYQSFKPREETNEAKAEDVAAPPSLGVEAKDSEEDG